VDGVFPVKIMKFEENSSI